MLNFKITTQPTVEPVTVAEARKHCRVLDNSEDDSLEGFISSAREYAEGVTGLALPEQTITAVCDSFPGSGEIKLPVGPVISITSLKYTDSDGNEATFTDYTLNDYCKPEKIVLNDGSDWPSVELGAVNPIKIEYQAGYEETANIPKKIKQAILLLVGHWFEHREEVITGVESFSVPMAAETLLQTMRHPRT